MPIVLPVVLPVKEPDPPPVVVSSDANVVFLNPVKESGRLEVIR